MFPGKTLITGLVILLAVLAGCSKKKDTSDNEFESSKTAADADKSATQEIFDEFYKEDTAASTGQETTPEPPLSRYTGPVSFSENGRYVVQVSTVVSRSLADNLSDKLNARGWPSYVAEVQNPTPELPGTYYRVRIGGFNRVSEARSFGENALTQEGYEFWVDNRSNDNVGLEGYGMGSGTETYSTESTTDYQSTTTYPYPAESGTASSPEATPAEPAAAPAPPAPSAPPAAKAAASPPPPPEPTPASEYTPETAEKEFSGQKQKTEESSPSSTQTQSEWGNDEW